MSTKTKGQESISEEVRSSIREFKPVASRGYALSKAAQILLSNDVVSESKVIEAYFLLVKEQHKGNLKYPVDYEFTFEAIRFAKKLKRLREKK